jgi:cysteine desulfurase
LATPLIVGLGEACAIAAGEMVAEAERVGGLRDRLLTRLMAAIPDLRVNGSRQARIAGNLNLTFPAATAFDLMRALPDLCVSTGSACSSAEVEASYVLRAMGLDPEQAARTLRIGVGRFTSAADVDYAAAALAAAHSAPLPRRQLIPH